MSRQSWYNRDKKTMSKRLLKNLGKPFRKSFQRDSKESREWSKTRKQLRKIEDKELEEGAE